MNELETKLYDLKDRLWKIKSEFDKFSSTTDEKYLNAKEKYEKVKFDLEIKIIELQAQLNTEYSNNEDVITDHFSDKNKRKIENINAFMNNFKNIINNPLINESYKDLLSDTYNVCVLNSFVNVFKSKYKDRLDDEGNKILETVYKVIDEYKKIIDGIKSNLMINIENNDTLIENKNYGDYREYREFERDVKEKSSKEDDLDNCNNEAHKHIEELNSENINIFKYELVDKLNTLLLKIQISMPEKNINYSGYDVDYSNMLDIIQVVSNELSNYKINITSRIEPNAFNEIKPTSNKKVGNKKIKKKDDEGKKLNNVFEFEEKN